ncbi:MAG TPA: threonine synthase [Myxococcaceae bacterium]|nr:threonine synthase [Myxococcaceae bacterium]
MATSSFYTGSALTHLQCSACGREHDANRLQNLCPDCGKVLLARYDLQRAARSLTKESVAARPRGMWRWRELLPVRETRHIVSLGEGDSPLLPVPRLGARAGLKRLLLKDEGSNPTGSFKARGISAALSRAAELGACDLALPTAGNAGGALAAYAARAGLKAHVYMPVDAPELNKKECGVCGAEVVLVRGLINDCGAWVRRRAAEEGWFDLSTLKEPYRAEGKKTMGLELVEQLGWSVPDILVYPTGGGTGLVGIWKALEELEQLGWIGSRRPRMIAVQTEGCAPIVRAFQQGLDHAPAVADAHTRIGGLRVPAAVADSLMLGLIRRSGGTALTVTDDEALDGMREIASSEGVFAAPEGGAVWAGIKKLVASGAIDREEQIVLMNTGTGLKYGELVSFDFPVVDRS